MQSCYYSENRNKKKLCFSVWCAGLSLFCRLLIVSSSQPQAPKTAYLLLRQWEATAVTWQRWVHWPAELMLLISLRRNSALPTFRWCSLVDDLNILSLVIVSSLVAGSFSCFAVFSFIQNFEVDILLPLPKEVMLLCCWLVCTVIVCRISLLC